MTTIYLIRHSKTLNVNNNFNTEDLQTQNEKKCLSIEGEQIAQKKLNNLNIDVLYSSNYVRAIQTAKYLMKDNLEINIINDLGERKFGIKSWDELPSDFEKSQFSDENYKIGDGESRKEVQDRMYSSIMKIVDENQNKTIGVVSHGTAMTFLLKKWCDIVMFDDELIYSFNGNILLDGYLDYCETFKLEFDENNKLINIELM